jgi:hypothetical protein
MSSLTMESIVRPFVKIESRPLNIVTPAPVTDPEEVPPAFIDWGAASNFIAPNTQVSGPLVVSTENDFDYSSFSGTVNRIQQTDSIFDWEREIELAEVERQTRTVRIYNPEELNLPVEERTSYLDVEVIDRISFRAPDGGRWAFVLNNESN